MLAQLRRAVLRVIRAPLQTALRSQYVRRLGAGFLSRYPIFGGRLLRIAGVTVPYVPEYGPHVARDELTETAQAICEDLSRLYQRRRVRDVQAIKPTENDGR